MKKILKSTLLLTITFACLALLFSAMSAKPHPYYGSLTGSASSTSGATSVSVNPDNAYLSLAITVSGTGIIEKHLYASNRGEPFVKASSPWMYIHSTDSPLGSPSGRITITSTHKVFGGTSGMADTEYCTSFED